MPKPPKAYGWQKICQSAEEKLSFIVQWFFQIEIALWLAMIDTKIRGYCFFAKDLGVWIQEIDGNI